MSSRRHILLIGGIYFLAIVGLLGAVWLVVRALPQAATAPVATPTTLGQDIPTLRPLWPPPPLKPGTGRVARVASRTPLATDAASTPVARPSTGTTPTTTLGAEPTLTLSAPAAEAVAVGATGQPALPSALPAAPAQGRISGRVTLEGAPAPAGLVLHLQTQAYATAAETTVNADGGYAFANVPDSGEGYDVTFAQDWNAAAYQRDTISTWAWLGPIKVQGGGEVRVPDLEISLAGMQLLTPAFDTSISSKTIAAGQPISFTWSAYPEAGAYWLDVTRGSDNQAFWQSPLVQSASVAWNGRSSTGSPLAAGDYWWSVGVRREVSPYTLIVYSYLTKFVISAN